MRIPLLAGAMCRDDSSTPTAVVNRSFANTYLPGSTAMGRHLIQPGNSFIPPSTILGIVGDAREIGSRPRTGSDRLLVLRRNSAGYVFPDPDAWRPEGAGGNDSPQDPRNRAARSVYGLMPLDEHLSDAYADNRLRTILLAFFALTAVSLACVGLYGTLSYMVHIRRREVGLRLALGAVRTQIVRQFLGQGMRVSLLGCAAGLGLAAVFTRLLAGMLFGVSAWDAATLTAVVVGVLAVSVIASLLPAIRAARVEPMQVLREE